MVEDWQISLPELVCDKRNAELAKIRNMASIGHFSYSKCQPQGWRGRWHAIEKLRNETGIIQRFLKHGSQREGSPSNNKKGQPGRLNVSTLYWTASKFNLWDKLCGINFDSHASYSCSSSNAQRSRSNYRCIHDFFKDVLTAFNFVALPVPQLGTIVQRS